MILPRFIRAFLRYGWFGSIVGALLIFEIIREPVYSLSMAFGFALIISTLKKVDRVVNASICFALGYFALFVDDCIRVHPAHPYRQRGIELLIALAASTIAMVRLLRLMKRDAEPLEHGTPSL